MTIADALSRVKKIAVEAGALPVIRRVAEELAGATGGEITVDGGVDSTRPAPGVFRLLASPPAEAGEASPDSDARNASPVTAAGRVPPDSVYVRLDGDGSGCVAASPIRLLFPFITYLLRDLGDEEIATAAGGRVFKAASNRCEIQAWKMSPA